MKKKTSAVGRAFTRRALTCALLACLAPPFGHQQARADTGDVEFDGDALRTYGMDPALADSFRHAPHFMAGNNQIDLTVNGQPRGRITATLDKQGQLCTTHALLQQAGLKATAKSALPCAALTAFIPRAEMTLYPAENSVVIVVPAENIVISGADRHWQHGGVATLLNYDAQGLVTSGDQGGTQFFLLNGELGFNADDWIVRSQQTATKSDGRFTLYHGNTLVQRTFPAIRKIFQAGQISLNNSLLSTGPVIGFQFFPDSALADNQQGPGLVQGIADTQSVVEVWQSGAQLYRTIVPAGPFTLRGFNLLNTRTDLLVRLTGADGHKRQFTVPAVSLPPAASAPAGMTFGFGQLTQQGAEQSPLMASVSGSWDVTPRLNINSGVVASQPWLSAGASLALTPFRQTTFRLQSTLADDRRHNIQGYSLTGEANHFLTERLSFGISASQYSTGYRELSNVISRQQEDNRHDSQQYNFNLNWSAPLVGSVNFSWSQLQNANSGSSRYLHVGWSRSFHGNFLGASLEQNSGGSSAKDRRFYLTLSIPFERDSLSSWLNNSQKGARMGIRYAGQPGRDWNYSLAAEHDKTSSLSASADTLTSFGHFSASLSHDADRYTAYSAGAEGAIVIHPQGVTLSPARIGDTFAIAHIGKERGVRLETPAGASWTDWRGYAVLPVLTGYKKSAIQIDTRTLNKNVDIANALYETDAARGAVAWVNFAVVHNRRALVKLRDAAGKPLMTNASVFRVDKFVTVTDKNSAAFLPEAVPGQQFEVEQSGKSDCHFTLTLPKTPPQDALYEEANAVCL